jgi:anti-sigma regulatory factor (Ser/Thr protein kinase)
MNDSACLPVVEDTAWIRVEEESAVGRCRRTASTLAEKLGFPATRVAEIGIAVTEIGTNLRKHAQEGSLLIRLVRASSQAALEVVAMDRGPGIADLALARKDGQSSVGTLGLGLGAVERLADASEITSVPGEGTVVVARFHPDRLPLAEIPADISAGITRAIEGEDVCGDSYAIRYGEGKLTLMMCDGSGHGPLAASASQAAVRVFREQEPTSPEETIRRIHAALKGTRGGAVAVADLDLIGRKVRFAGLGNIAAAVLSGERKQGMISVPGVAGYQARTIRAYDYELPEGAVVVLHSDGLTERWTMDRREGLFRSGPLMIATTLLRDAGLRRDDACVLVGKPPRR